MLLQIFTPNRFSHIMWFCFKQRNLFNVHIHELYSFAKFCTWSNAHIIFLIKETNGPHSLAFYLYFHSMSSSSFKCKTKSCGGYSGYILHETNSNTPTTHIFLEFEEGTSICITIFQLSNLTHQQLTCILNSEKQYKIHNTRDRDSMHKATSFCFLT